MNYKQIYITHFGYDRSDWIGCEYCNKTSVDIHHLIFRSQGGKDTPQNLMALCRECHTKAHHSREFNEELKTIHNQNL